MMTSQNRRDEMVTTATQAERETLRRSHSKNSGIESMAHVGQPPWANGLGVQVDNKMTPEQMAKAASIDWTVSKRDIFYMDKSKHSKIIKDRKVLVRDTDEYPFTITGTNWKPVQNLEAVDFFKKFVVSGHMSMEHMGSLGHGKFIWALAKINKSFSLGKEDEVTGYLLLMSPHVQGRAMVIQNLSMRGWCWNSLTRKLTASGEGTFRMPHSIEFNDVTKKAAEATLKIAVENFKTFQEEATLLSKTKVNEKQVEQFFCDVMKYDPKKAAAESAKEKTEPQEPRMLEQLRQALEFSPGNQLPSAKGTLWGAVNAVTYVCDHELGRARDTALKSAWFGGKAAIKRRAFDLALERAK
jgi:phage/plasmid-like protein (TIGR03299 family)